MKWGYSGYTKSETNRLVHSVKAKEELNSYYDDVEDCDIPSIENQRKIPKKLKNKEF